MKIEYSAIGTIYTPFEKKEGMPIQTISGKGIKGTIEINKEFELGLTDLEGFSHIFLIYYFHKSEGFDLKVKPFLDDTFFGVFATRAPKRPNAIGISVVKLVSVKNNILEIENVDILNETPLLDIKPYIPEIDIHKVEKIGWLESITSKISETKSDNRFK